MNIDVTLTASLTNPTRLSGKTAVVIDTLRATSTIVTALANGCHSIIPVFSTENAILTAKNYNPDKILLGGETKGIPPQGFHLGNSPLEYTEEKVNNKTIIFTTTNGTKAIQKSTPAQQIIITSLLNVKATANRIVKTTHQDLHIICAGTKNKFSLEDTLTAGLLIQHIKKIHPKINLTDVARTAYHIYLTYHNNLLYPLQKSTNGRNLTKLGFCKDIQYCAQVNKYDLVPQYYGGVITADINKKTTNCVGAHE